MRTKKSKIKYRKTKNKNKNRKTKNKIKGGAAFGGSDPSLKTYVDERLNDLYGHVRDEISELKIKIIKCCAEARDRDSRVPPLPASGGGGGGDWRFGIEYPDGEANLPGRGMHSRSHYPNAGYLHYMGIGPVPKDYKEANNI